MFANMNLGVMNTSFPDIAQAPMAGGPVPVPYPNVAQSTTHIPSVMQTVMGGGSAGGPALGGMNPLAFLSMMGGGEPAGPAVGASIVPSQMRVMLGG
jgi:hypothetical protein